MRVDKLKNKNEVIKHLQEEGKGNYLAVSPSVRWDIPNKRASVRCWDAQMNRADVPITHLLEPNEWPSLLDYYRSLGYLILDEAIKEPSGGFNVVLEDDDDRPDGFGPMADIV